MERDMLNRIIAILKGSEGIRTTYDYRWLVWYDEQWTIFEQEPYKKKSRIIWQTDNLELALEKLTEAP